MKVSPNIKGGPTKSCSYFLLPPSSPARPRSSELRAARAQKYKSSRLLDEKNLTSFEAMAAFDIFIAILGGAILPCLGSLIKQAIITTLLSLDLVGRTLKC